MNRKTETHSTDALYADDTRTDSKPGQEFAYSEKSILGTLSHAGKAQLAEFWREVEEIGTPIRDPHSARTTFLWRTPATDPFEGQPVQLTLNRFTDKHAYELGRMRHVPGTDIWVRTLELPATLRASYGFSKHLPPDQRVIAPPPHNRYPSFIDPLNPNAPLVRESSESLAPPMSQELTQVSASSPIARSIPVSGSTASKSKGAAGVAKTEEVGKVGGFSQLSTVPAPGRRSQMRAAPTPDHGLSIVRGPLAPPQSEWENAGELAGYVVSKNLALQLPELGNPLRPCHLYLPVPGSPKYPEHSERTERSEHCEHPGHPERTECTECPEHPERKTPVSARKPGDAQLAGTGIPLLVVFDAQTWFGRLNLPAALEKASAAGRIPPVAVLGIENLSKKDRVTSLGPHPAFMHSVIEDAIAWAEGVAAERGTLLAGAEQRILAGQSLGGLTALWSAFTFPGAFGATISQSPSMWWTPDRVSSPRDLGNRTPDWITEFVNDQPAAANRFFLQVGVQEGQSVNHVHALDLVLRARGNMTNPRVYDGGHDYAWWRGGLIDALAAVGD